MGRSYAIMVLWVLRSHIDLRYRQSSPYKDWAVLISWTSFWCWVRFM